MKEKKRWNIITNKTVGLLVLQRSKNLFFLLLNGGVQTFLQHENTQRAAVLSYVVLHTAVFSHVVWFV